MTTQFKTENGLFLLVKVPEDVTTVGITMNYLIGNSCTFKQKILLRLPEGQWSIIGNPFELSEEQWQTVCDQHINISDCSVRATGFVYTAVWNDYQTKDHYRNYFASANESGLSLLKSHQIYKEKPDECLNPFCENGKIDMGYNEYSSCSICEKIEERTGSFILLREI